MKCKKMKWIAVISAVMLAVVVFTVAVLAYFSTVVYVYTADGDKIKFHAGMHLSVLFERLNSNIDDSGKITLPFIDYDNTANSENPVYYDYDETAEWGSAQNPYVISDIRHLQNLSALQDIGYFYKLNIVKNFTTNTDGTLTYTEKSNEKPYFLICNKDGTPVTINGGGIAIKPIGTDEYPFIGEVSGAIATGETTVPVKDGLSSDTSAIYNVKVMSKRKMPDHGLFGIVSYLGAAPGTTGYDEKNGNFKGYVSSISDLLMADVTLEVKSENFIDEVADWMQTHIFSYGMLEESVQKSVPHETHHIGILAGHIHYADVKNISVYYSSDEVKCIDLNDTDMYTRDGESTNANYFSSTGIVGYIYSMNPDYAGNVIQKDTGSSSTSVGAIGGGGEKSGVFPGYVLAADLYDKFFEFSKPPVLTSDGLVTYKSNANVNADDIGFQVFVSLVEKTKDSDGKVTSYEASYEDGLRRKLIPGSTTTYSSNGISVTGVYNGGGWTYEGSTVGDGGVFFYCQNQIVGYDSDGNFETDDCYYSAITKIEFDTFTSAYGDSTTVVRLGGTSMTNDPVEKVNSINNDMYIYAIKREDGAEFCEQWYRDRMGSGFISGLGKEATGRYYFWDGVFTFALSSMKDTVSEIWPSMSNDEQTLASIKLTQGTWSTGEVPVYKTQLTLTPVASLNSDDLYILTNDTDLSDAHFLNLLGGENSGIASTAFSDLGIELVSNDNGYSMLANDTTAFNSFIFKYNNNRIESAAASGTYLGVKTVHYYLLWGLLSSTQNFSLYAGKGNEASNTSKQDDGDDIITIYEHYEYQVAVNNSKLTFKAKYGNKTQNTSIKNVYMYFADDQFQVDDDATASKFRIYKVEISPVKEMVPGLNAPSSAQSFDADKYVLYPLNSFAGTESGDTTYGLISMDKLGAQHSEDKKTGTWRYENGQLLSEYKGQKYGDIGLKYLFNLVNGTRYGTVRANMQGIGGDYDPDNAFVRAKLGDDGTETYIPMGCISFKVKKDVPKDENGDPIDPIKIRVIVAVPTSTMAGGLSETEDYYFALWKYSLYSGSSADFTFSKEDAYEKFELPRSQPLSKDENGNFVTTNAATTVYTDTNGSGVIEDPEKTDANRYITYFQGETVLVAYEFEVAESGVYTMGAINGSMKIVYFSADGVASSGADGTGGAQLEGIDFVYDNCGYNSPTTTENNTNKIITVNNTPLEGTTDQDYNYYYASHFLMYFNNEALYRTELVNIYNEEITVRRYCDSDAPKTQKISIDFKVSGNDLTSEKNRYVMYKTYSDLFDNVQYSFKSLLEDDGSSP